MKVKVLNYEIEGEHGEYTVRLIGKVTDKKTGSIKYGPKKQVYYGKVSQCLKYLLDCHISGDDVKTLKDIQNKIKEFEEAVENIKEFKK